MDMPPPSHYEYLQKSFPEASSSNKTKIAALRAMKNLYGWCSEYKATVLIDLIEELKPKTVVEIGVFGGKSLIPMGVALKALRLGVIYGIDPWTQESSAVGMEGDHKTYWESIDHEQIFSSVKTSIRKLKLQDHVRLIKQTSAKATPPSDIDLLHVDGNHSEEAAYFDVLKWVPYVRKGGIVVFDDISKWEGTKKAVDWLDANCTRLQTITDDDNDFGIWVKL